MNPLPDLSATCRASSCEHRLCNQRRTFLRRFLFATLGALLVLSMVATFSTITLAQEDENGYIYTVQRGDNWTTVARLVGLTEEELKAANPQAVRPTGWLIVGETLFIPTSEPVDEEYYVVQPGDGWTTIATELGVSTALLQALNPRSLREGEILFVGERLLIPAPARQPATTTTTVTTTVGTGTPTATARAPRIPGETPTVQPSPTRVTGTPAARTTPPPTASPTPTSTVEEPATPTPADTETTGREAVIPECPEDFEDYPEAVVDVLNSTEGSEESLASFLADCGIGENTVLAQVEVTGADMEAVAVTYQRSDDEARSSVGRRSELLILNRAGGDDAEYRLGYIAYAAGRVELVSTEDINGDEKPDVVWVDTTCGASTCFASVYIRSWDGSAWRDWTEGTITMAGAEVTLVEGSEEGSGLELHVSGGQYGSVGAGPQRARTEIWGSVDGGPYRLIGETFAPSDCLYHTVLDANRAFGAADFATAQSLYEEALANEGLIACWMRSQELDELRSFALFRLALLSGYEGDPDTSEALVDQLADTYPEMPYTEIGQRWFNSYLSSGDLRRACVEVNTFATENNASVEMLADYGYANPSFTATDVCPLLNVQAPIIAGRGEEGAGDNESSPTAPLATDPDEEEISAAALILTEDLPECPASLAAYSDVLPVVLEGTDDPLVLETWLRLCSALADDRGDLIFFDLNDDDLGDLIIFPTIISDAGYGPGGAEGILMISHLTESGTYTTALSQEVYGRPTVLAVGDSNADGVPELIWQVESCATFCVTGVQSLSWDGESYVPGILPGAATANGRVFLEAVAAGDPGDGRQIRLVGGVSGTPGGGLVVPHEEIWQSVDGSPYRRLSWTYDREVEESACLGLRLIEADVALQASAVLGYGPAIELYSDALSDDTLLACSQFEMEAEEELSLQRGLAGFRLIQAQALNNDMDAAQATLDTLVEAEPDGAYTSVAETWLDSYMAGGSAVAACEEIADIFTVSNKLWQVTDQYGYDHPALAAEQICFIPSE